MLDTVINSPSVGVSSDAGVAVGACVGVGLNDDDGPVAVDSGTSVGTGADVGVSDGSDSGVLTRAEVVVGSSVAADGGLSSHADNIATARQLASPARTIC